MYGHDLSLCVCYRTIMTPRARARVCVCVCVLVCVCHPPPVASPSQRAAPGLTINLRRSELVTTLAVYLADGRR